MTSREIIQLLLADGWILKHIKGDHYNYAHPSKPGIVTVTHPRKDFPIGTLKSIERQSGLKFGRK
jgi:predicted RNA binding protein YcfA (HicA-like mRNA interferase family)